MKMHPRRSKALKTAAFCLAFTALSCGIAFASGGGELPTGKDWMWRVINFAIIAGVLGYLLAKPFRTFMKTRTESIENALAEAKAAREDALRRLADVQDKLKNKDAELASLLRIADENGRKERDLLLAESEKMSADIVASAKENIGAEVLKAKESIRREAALMAVELAEKMVRDNIKKEDQVRIVEEYIAKVGG